MSVACQSKPDHYHLELQANPPKIVQQNPMLFLASMGETGFPHDLFLFSLFYCTLVSNAKGNIAKSNKSELWNYLSYRGLP